MLAEKRYEVARHVDYRPKRRKKASIFGAMMRSQMACILAVAVAALLLLIPYVSAYAKATQKGYDKAALLSHLHKVKMVNETLRIKLDALRQPERIEEFAVASKMLQSQQIAYLRNAGHSNVAQNVDNREIR